MGLTSFECCDAFKFFWGINRRFCDIFRQYCKVIQNEIYRSWMVYAKTNHKRSINFVMFLQLINLPITFFPTKFILVSVSASLFNGTHLTHICQNKENYIFAGSLVQNLTSNKHLLDRPAWGPKRIDCDVLRASLVDFSVSKLYPKFSDK